MKFSDLFKFKTYKSLFGDTEQKPDLSGMKKKTEKMEAPKTDLHVYPKSTVTKSTNPNMLHKDWQEHLQAYGGDFEKFRNNFNLGKMPEGLKKHISHNFGLKNLPSPDNNYNIPEDETRANKVQALYEKGYKQYADRYVDMPKMEKWFSETQKKFRSHMDENEIKEPGKVDMNNIDFQHKDKYSPEQLDYFKHALDEHKSALSVLMHIEDPGLLTSPDRKKIKFGGQEKTEIPETSNLYKTMVSPFLKKHSEINEGGYDMEAMKEWFGQLNKPQKSNVKNKIHIYDTYSDMDAESFDKATEKPRGKYKYQDYVDNPFSPDELLYRYTHKTDGHNLYTKNYYDLNGNIGEAPEVDSESHRATKGGGSAIQDYLNKNKKSLSENFEEDSKFDENDFKKYAEGTKVEDLPLSYSVSGVDKDKGEVELSNPYTNDLIPILNNLAMQMKMPHNFYSQKTDLSGALKQLHSDLQESNPDAVYPDALEGGNYKSVKEHLEDISNNRGKYLTAKERELQGHIEEEAKKQGIDLSKSYPKEGIQRSMFESDDDFEKRYKQWEADNPLYVRQAKAWDKINAKKKILDDYRKKNIDTPEHQKAVKSLMEEVFNTVNPHENIDADKYINVHKQVQKLGEVIKKRPGKDATPEDWKAHDANMNKYLEARNILESMHPTFTPEKLRDKQRETEGLYKKYSDLHRWALTRDKTKMPIAELKNQGGKKKLQPHSWEQMANMDTDVLKKAGISPGMIQHVKDSHPDLYEGKYEPEKLTPEQKYLEIYRLAKSHALHQVTGAHAPLNVQSLQNFALSTQGLDKGQIREKLGLKSDYEKKKLEHLLEYGVQSGLFEREGKKFKLAPKQVQPIVKKSIFSSLKGNIIFRSLNNKVEQKPETQAQEDNEFYNEKYNDYKHNSPGYENDYHRGHVQGLINNFRKDTTEDALGQFDEEIEKMNAADLISYREQLQAIKREFENELGVRSLDDGTKTPYSDPEFRDYMYMENLVGKQLDKLNNLMVERFLNPKDNADN